MTLTEHDQKTNKILQLMDYNSKKYQDLFQRKLDSLRLPPQTKNTWPIYPGSEKGHIAEKIVEHLSCKIQWQMYYMYVAWADLVEERVYDDYKERGQEVNDGLYRMTLGEHHKEAEYKHFLLRILRETTRYISEAAKLGFMSRRTLNDADRVEVAEGRRIDVGKMNLMRLDDQVVKFVRELVYDFYWEAEIKTVRKDWRTLKRFGGGRDW